MIELRDGYSILTKEGCKWCVKVKELLPNAHYVKSVSYTHLTLPTIYSV